MTIVKAKHRELTDKNGQPLVQEFDQIQWLTKWQSTGEWIYLGKYEQETNVASRGIEEPTATAKTLKVKKGCGCKKK